MFTKSNLIILLAGLILALALFAPTRSILVCPQGRTSDPVPGGSCPLFIDENRDTLCDYLYKTAIPTSSTFQFDYLRELVIFVLLFVISIILQASNWRHKSTVRYLILGFSLVYFGFLFAKKLCPVATLQALFILKEAVVLRLPIFLIFFLPIIISLVFGRIYCGWLCPLGSFQEIFFKIFQKLGVKPIKISKKYEKFLRTLPFLVLVIIIAAALTADQMIFCQLEPFGFLFGRRTNIIPVALFIALIFLLPFVFRPFCRYICPYGAILSFLRAFHSEKNFEADIKKINSHENSRDSGHFL